MPTLASSSRVQMGYIAEATFGTTPGAGNYKNIRATGESLKYDISKTSSAEINATRAISSQVPTSATASGDLNGEMQYAEYDPLIAATLQSTFVSVGTNGVTAGISVTFTATTLAGTGIGTNLVAGQFFMVTGTSNVLLDNILFRCSKSVVPTANLITLDASTPAAISGPHAATVLKSSRLTHGTTQTSYSIERQSADVTEYFNYRGMTPSMMKIGVSTGSLSTANFSFMGKDAVRSATTSLPGTAVASQSYDVMAGVAGTACSVWEGGTPITGTFVRSVDIDYNNTLRAQGALCSLGSVGIGSGTIECKVNAKIYFTSGAQFYSKFLANTSTEIVFTAFDTSGNGYVFTLPTANIGNYTVNASSKDQDMEVTIELTALLDAANATAGLRKLIFIDRIGAAVTP